MKRSGRRDIHAMQMRLNIVFLIFAILCLLSVNVKAQEIEGPARNQYKGTLYGELGEGGFEIKDKNGKEVSFDLLQPGVYAIRLAIEGESIDIRSNSDVTARPKGHRSGSFIVYKIENAVIRDFTDEDKNKGFTKADGWYALEVVPDIMELEKKDTQLNIHFQRAVVAGNTIQGVIDAKLKTPRKRFESKLDIFPRYIVSPLSPEGRKDPLSMTRHDPAVSKFNIVQNFEIDLDTFTFGTETVNFRESCAGSALSDDNPCVLTLKDATTRVEGEFRFKKVRKHGKFVIEARATFMPGTQRINANGDKIPFYEDEFIKKFLRRGYRVNAQGRRVEEEMLLFEIDVKAKNILGKEDTSTVILNHQKGDWASPYHDGDECDGGLVIDGGNGITALLQLGKSDAAAKMGIAVNSSKFEGGSRRADARVKWNIIAKLSELQKYIGSITVNGSKHPVIVTNRLRDDGKLGVINANDFARALAVGAIPNYDVSVGDVFYAAEQGNDTAIAYKIVSADNGIEARRVGNIRIKN